MAEDFGFKPDEQDEYGFAPDEKAAPKKISAPESALAGAEEGLTMGFADEIGGAIGAGLEGVSEAWKQRSVSPISDANLIKLYEEYRDFNRSRYDQAQQANPNSNMVGNIAGGLLLPIGAAGNLGKTATTAAKAKAGMKIGAGMGAVSAAGTSESELISPEFAKDVAIGAGIGGALGGTIPYAADYVVKPVANSTAEGLGWLGGRIFGPTSDAYKRGMDKLNLLTESGQKAGMKQVGTTAENVAPAIQNKLQDLATLKKELISEAQAMGYKIDEYEIDKLLETRLGMNAKSNLPEATRELEQFKELLRSANEGKLVRRQKQVEMPTGKEQVRRIEELKKAEQQAIESGVDPADIDTVYEDVDVPGQVAAVVRQRMYNENPETGELVDAGFRKLASKLIKEDEIPGFKTVTEQVRAGGKKLSNVEEMHQLYKDLKEKSQFGDQGFKSAEVRRVTGETIQDIQNLLRTGNLQGEVIENHGIPQLQKTDEVIHKYNKALGKLGITDSQDFDADKVRDRVIGLIGQEGKMNVGAVKAQERIDDFLKELGSVNPQMAEKMGAELADSGQLLNTMQHINKPVTSAVNAINPLAWSRAFGTGGANITGVAVRGMKDIGKEGVAKVSQMTPDWLKQSANRLAQSTKPAEKELSNLLFKVADKDDRARNATLAVLLQSPAYRKILGMSDTDQEEVK